MSPITKHLPGIITLSLSLKFIVSSFLISFSVGSYSLLAQPDSKQPANGFKVFYEKVYVHTDRDYYVAGDDIWFKAYLVNALSNVPMATSNNLYVELISPDLKIADSKLIRLNEGSGNGDFKISDSIPGGTYCLRAYTKWMRNFDNNFVFEKKIMIYNVNEKSASKESSSLKKPSIQFFPEGGSLISETMNLVAFKGVDGSGKGVQVKGSVVTSKGDTLNWFESYNLGMGYFTLMPLQGETYFATGLLGKVPFKVQLPSALDTGFSIHAIDKDTVTILISISTNKATFEKRSGQEMALVGRIHGKSYYSGEFTFNRQSLLLKIDKKDFPGGLACFTLYDAGLKPQCERLVYIEPRNSAILKIVPDKKSYKVREKVNLNFSLTDKQNLPLDADCSVAVLDADQVPDRVSDIQTYLQLQSELKGEIEQPLQYFDTTNVNRFKYLDLLLLTQGWRDFLWRRLKDTSFTIKYLMEPGISISGRVRQKFENKPLPDMNITAFIKGSGKTSLYFTKTQADGHYYLDGLEFYGNKNIILSSRNDKGKNGGWILADSVYLDPLTIKSPDFLPFDNLKNSSFAKDAAQIQSTLKKYSLSDTIKLNEVVVSASKQKEDKQLMEHTVEAGTPDYNFKIGPDDYSFTDIGLFLLEKVPGARIGGASNAEEAPNRVLFNVTGDLQPPRFILDGHRFEKGDLVDESFIYSLSIEEIDRIVISKTDVMAPGGQGVVISIYTNPNASVKKDFYTINTKINGYYEAKVFYSPDYSKPVTDVKPDLRTTIFWVPNLIINKVGKASISFYNSDKTTHVKIFVEGLTNQGIPVVATAAYEVK